MRPPLEVADIFLKDGAAWRRARAGHLSLGQLKVMLPSNVAEPTVSAVTGCAVSRATMT